MSWRLLRSLISDIKWNGRQCRSW